MLILAVYIWPAYSPPWMSLRTVATLLFPSGPGGALTGLAFCLVFYGAPHDSTNARKLA